MGFTFLPENINRVMEAWERDYVIFAPKNFSHGATFSDVDCVRYGQVSKIEQVVFDKKSEYSFKEVLLPLSETLFYFTEDEVKQADTYKKSAIVFLRSCDLHSVKRLDEIYLNNGEKDYYYKRFRDKVKFVLMGCMEAFDSCFCVDMNTNITYDYDASVDYKNGQFFVDNKNSDWEDVLSANADDVVGVSPAYVTKTYTRVNVSKDISIDSYEDSLWKEYDSRCINCGRCNFVCPTCTCFTMQDLFYGENGRVGERRRVQASCMVDGFTDVAGGGAYRKNNSQKMRFRVMHKVYDFNQRFGYHMCVGCGRCDDVCPEYISFSSCVNKLSKCAKEAKYE